MRILVLSDSHYASLEHLDFKKYDAVIHCGDYGNSFQTLTRNHVFFVKGNCDLYGDESLLFELFGKKIFVTHGNKENVKFDFNCLVYKSLEKGAELTFFGHTHQQTYFEEKGILFLNPGSYPTSYIEITEESLIFYQNGKRNSIVYRW